MLGVGVGLCAGLSQAFDSIVMRKVNSFGSVHYILIPFWTSIGILMIGLVGFLTNSLHFDQYDRIDCLYMAVSGALAVVGTEFLSFSFKRQDASKLSPFFYLMVVYNYIFDIFWMKLTISWLEVLGTTLITVCILSLIHI